MTIWYSGRMGADSEGSSTVDIDDWDTRSAGEDEQLGVYTPTGALYRYSDIVGDWVRYESGIPADFIAKIDGDKLPYTEEDPVWDRYDPPSGTQSIDGDAVKFHLGDSRVACDYPVAIPNKAAFQGYVKTDNASGASLSRSVIRFGVGSEKIKISFDAHDRTGVSFYYANTSSGCYTEEVDLDPDFRWLECVAYDSGSLVQAVMWADHDPLPFAIASALCFDDGTYDAVYVGDISGVASAETWVKQLRVWTCEE